MTTEEFSARTDDSGVYLVGSEGTRVYIDASDEHQSKVTAQRIGSMLNHHNRREAFELGRERSYSGSCLPPGVIGSDHVEDRSTLLKVAHQAETQAELWDRYRAQVRTALYPPDIAEIDAAPGIERYNIVNEVSFGRTYPRNARAIPQDLREALLLATAYATENMQAYLDVADACRQEHKNRYAGENAALRDQAAGQMANDLRED